MLCVYTLSSSFVFVTTNKTLFTDGMCSESGTLFMFARLCQILSNLHNFCCVKSKCNWKYCYIYLITTLIYILHTAYYTECNAQTLLHKGVIMRLRPMPLRWTLDFVYSSWPSLSQTGTTSIVVSHHMIAETQTRVSQWTVSSGNCKRQRSSGDAVMLFRYTTLTYLLSRTVKYHCVSRRAVSLRNSVTGWCLVGCMVQR